MNINNPSMQDIEDAMKEKFEKEDAYWKALEKAQEEAYYKAMEELNLGLKQHKMSTKVVQPMSNHE